MKEKKDVAFLCQFFYPEYVSSATLPFDTAKKLVESNFTVGALCGYPYEYCSEKVPLKECVDGVEIKRLKYTKFKKNSKIGRIINYFSFIIKAYFNIKYFKKYKTIIVYSNPPLLPWVALKAKKRYGCKIVFVAYDIYPEIAINTNSISENGMICKLMKKVNKVFFKKVDKVVALSEEMKDYIIQNRNIEKDKVEVIPNWYKDEYQYLMNSNKKEINNEFYQKLSGKTVISYLGNMGTCQDIETIIDAAKALEDNEKYIFLFAGQGNKVELVKKEISNGAKNILFYDFLHGSDYLDVLNLTSYAVISLTKNLSGLCVPSKSYAYMMRNLPIIGILNKNMDLSKDIIDSESGIVVDNGDSEKIVEFLLKSEFNSKIREVYLNKYTPDITLQKYVDLLSSLNEEDIND